MEEKSVACFFGQSLFGNSCMRRRHILTNLDWAGMLRRESWYCTTQAEAARAQVQANPFFAIRISCSVTPLLAPRFICIPVRFRSKTEEKKREKLLPRLATRAGLTFKRSRFRRQKSNFRYSTFSFPLFFLLLLLLAGGESRYHARICLGEGGGEEEGEAIY